MDYEKSSRAAEKVEAVVLNGQQLLKHLSQQNQKAALSSPFAQQYVGSHPEEIEEGVTEYFLRGFGCNDRGSNLTVHEDVLKILAEAAFPIDLEYAIEFFESLLDVEAIEEKGIVFTPKYIAEYIVRQAMERVSEWSDDYVIVDPACGCGIFLIAAAEYIHNRFHIPMHQIIAQNIFGFDIEAGNIRRCKLVLKLLNAQYHGGPIDIHHIFCCDSLKSNWNTLIGRENINFIL